MKKLIAASLLSLVISSAMAASPEVIKAVLSSKAIGNVQNINKIEVVATYRCPNCYDIELTGSNILGEAAVKVRTEQLANGNLSVKYIEGTK